MHRFTRKRVLVALPIGLVVVGAAIAAWIVFSGVSGSGGAKVGNASSYAITLTANPAAASNELLPGGDADFAATASNPAPVTATLTSITLSGPVTTDAPSCTIPAGVITLNAGQFGGLSIPSGSSTVVAPNGAHASAALPDCLQGHTLTIPVTGTAVPQ